MRRLALALLAFLVASIAARAADPCAGTVTSGSGDVVVEGKQAARAGDAVGCARSTIVQGSPNVFINGKPAAVQGDQTWCGGAVGSGASGGVIQGQPIGRGGGRPRPRRH